MSSLARGLGKSAPVQRSEKIDKNNPSEHAVQPEGNAAAQEELAGASTEPSLDTGFLQEAEQLVDEGEAARDLARAEEKSAADTAVPEREAEKKAAAAADCQASDDAFMEAVQLLKVLMALLLTQMPELTALLGRVPGEVASKAPAQPTKAPETGRGGADKKRELDKRREVEERGGDKPGRETSKAPQGGRNRDKLDAGGPSKNRPPSVDGLEECDERPRHVKHRDSTVVRTKGGYTVELKLPEVLIYNDKGRKITRIWGDPHVDEDGDGKDDWHFGKDSTFVLPDGTKLCLDTEPNEVGEWYVVGADIIQGYDRFHVDAETAEMSDDGVEFDEARADAQDDATAGVFAMTDEGDWARADLRTGEFHDVNSESWSEYQASRDVTVNGQERSGHISLAAKKAVFGNKKQNLKRASQS